MTSQVFNLLPGFIKKRQGSPEKAQTLGSRAMRGSAWTLGSYVVTQALRFVSNVALAWLLFPKAFGLMGMVAIFISGLQLFSDLGVGANIVQHDDSEDPKFLRTAQTVQALRGVVLFLGACILSFPIALAYMEWQLVDLLSMSGVTVLIAGLNSPSLHIAKRKLALKQWTVIEVSSKVVSSVTMIGIALAWPTVYALPLGSIVGAIFKMILTHTIIPGPAMHFGWDRPSLKEIIRFGKWVWVSTAISFLATKGDKLIVAGIIGSSMFGMFGIALMFATLPTMLVRRVANDVLFPAIAELRREKPKTVNRKLRKARFVLMMPIVTLTMGMVFLGPWFVGLIYPEEYADTGWMLSILAFDPLVTILSLSYSRALLAYGRSKDTAFVMAFEVVIRMAGLYIGYQLAGTAGLIASLPISSCLIYPIMAYRVHKIKLLQLDIDLLTIGIGGVIASVALLLL